MSAHSRRRPSAPLVDAKALRRVWLAVNQVAEEIEALDRSAVDEGRIATLNLLDLARWLVNQVRVKFGEYGLEEVDRG